LNPVIEKIDNLKAKVGVKKKSSKGDRKE
jgi:hypothetical protein